MARLMLVDDGRGRVAGLESELSTATLQIITTRLDKGTVERIKRQRPDAVVMADAQTDQEHGDAFARLRQWDAGLPVILVGEASAGTDATIEAMKRGAMDYMTWPVDPESLGRQVDAALEQSRLSAQSPDTPADGDDQAGLPDRMIGRCEAMQQVYKTIGRVAQENVSVLIVGESGTGKELVARAIHHHSTRADKPFLAINCAALPEPLLESELFGHEQGAFTGAQRQRIGKFQQADGGTLLLDELGDMSPLIQAKFLRILQDGCFERVGGNETLHANVRIIAATNQDLEAKIHSGEFRSDLFYRLSGFTIPLPPLRQRSEDLPLLVEHFIRLASRHGTRGTLRISDAAMQTLQRHCWPGNIRELQSAVTFAVVHAVGEVITPECLPENCRTAVDGSLGDNGPLRANARGDKIPEQKSPGDKRPADLLGIATHIRRRLAAGDSDFYHELIREVDRVALEETLGHVQGNQVQASRRLGVSRNTLRSKLAQLHQCDPG